MSVRLQKVSTTAHGAGTSRFATWTAVSAAAISLFAINAHAAEEVPHRTVSYDDLDLANPADAQALYSRLEHASKAVCRSYESREVTRMKLHQNCYEEALSNAVASVDHATVTALYRSDSNVRLAQRGSDPRSRT